MKALLCLASLVICAVALSESSVQDRTGLNTREEFPDQFNKIIVGPLDAEFYGLDAEDDADTDDVGEENDEPLGDIEEEIEAILDDLDQADIEEEVVEEVEVDVEEGDEEEDGGNHQHGRRRFHRRNRNRKQWRKFGRQSGRQVSRFMNRRNLTDIESVPPRKFKGRLSQVHRRLRQEGEVGDMKGPMRRLYKKVIRKVNRRPAQEESNRKMAGVCRKISIRSSPRRGLVQRLPAALREEYTQMFSSRRTQLTQCCQMQDIDARNLCFAESHLDRMDQMCTLTLRHQQLGSARGLKFKNWQRKADCCEIVDDDERGECFQEIGSDLRTQKKQKRKQKTPETRATAVCRKVGRPIRGVWFKKLFSQMNDTETNTWKAIFQQRREDMKTCCQHNTMRETLNCAEDLKELRYERVCAGEEDFKPEPRYNPHKHGLLVTNCCQLEGAPRYMCFNRRGRNLQPEEDLTRVDTVMTDAGGIPVSTKPVEIIDGQIYIEVEVEEEEEEEEALEDMMMGDAPSEGGRRGAGRGRGGGRRRGQDRSEVKRVKRECCTQGTTLGESFPNDGKAILVRQEQCAANSETYTEGMDELANLCGRIYKRCCLKTGRQAPCSDEDGDGECGRRRGGRRRNKQKKRVHMNVEMDGEAEDMDEMVEELEKAIEEVADQV